MNAKVTQKGIVIDFDNEAEYMAVCTFIKTTKPTDLLSGGTLITKDIPVVFTKFDGSGGLLTNL